MFIWRSLMHKGYINIVGNPPFEYCDWRQRIQRREYRLVSKSMSAWRLSTKLRARVSLLDCVWDDKLLTWYQEYALLTGLRRIQMSLALGSSACARRGAFSLSKYVALFSNSVAAELLGCGKNSIYLKNSIFYILIKIYKFHRMVHYFVSWHFGIIQRQMKNKSLYQW